MPSPDVSPYIDLALTTPSSQAIYLAALNRARSLLPEWKPLEGAIELVAMQAFALEVAELMNSVNRIPDMTTEVLLKLHGVERSTGNKATGAVKFTAVNGNGGLGYIIPIGTQVGYVQQSESGVQDPLVLVTTAEVTTSSTGPFQATAPVQSLAVGPSFNGLPPGTRLFSVRNTPFIEDVEVSTALSGGTSPEDDATYFSRASARLDRLTEVLVRPKDFVAYTLENPNGEFTEVYRAYALDNTNGTAASAGAASDGLADLAASVVPEVDGHITIAVAEVDGELIAANLRAAIQDALSERCMTNLIVSVIDASVIDVDIVANVRKHTVADSSDVEAESVAAIENWLSPNTWDWSERVRYNEAVAILGNVPGTDYVNTLSIVVADSDVTELDGDDVVVKDPLVGALAPLFRIRNLTIDVA